MKHKILINTIPFIAGVCMGQNIQNTYVDAKLLAAYYSPPYKTVDVGAIWKKYGNAAALDSNPFFKKMKLEVPPVAFEKTTGSGGSGSPKSFVVESLNPASIIGADWQSAIIGGLANFMAERFQSEMVHTGLDQAFSRIRNADDVETIRSLFPKTLKQLEAMYSKTQANSYYSSDLMFLREILLTDLSEMPENIFRSDLLAKNMMPKEHDLLLAGYYSLKFMKQGFSLQKVLEKLSRQEFKSEDMRANFQLAYLFSESLIASEGAKTKWINPIIDLDFVPYVANLEVNTIYAYYGLLYEQLKTTKLGVKLSKRPIDEWASVMQQASQFVIKLNDAYELAHAHDFKFNTNAEIMEYALSFTEGIQSFLSSPAIAVDENLIKLVGKFSRISEPFLDKNYQKAIPVMISELADYLSATGEVKYIRSVSFLAQLATAKSDDELEMVIKAYALPIGGSSIKRHSEFNISVNGYAGFVLGRELAYTAEGRKTKTNVGLSAPIGISITKNQFSVFASVVDLGTLVNARVNNDTTAFSGLKIQNFVAPGLGIFYNAPKLPFTFGLYYSYIPGLRTVKLEAPGSAQKNVDVSRFNLTAMVDIPLYTLYNRDKENAVPKKRKK